MIEDWKSIYFNDSEIFHEFPEMKCKGANRVKQSDEKIVVCYFKITPHLIFLLFTETKTTEGCRIFNKAVGHLVRFCECYK